MLQELERALELATNSCVGGPLVENVHRLIKFRKDGFAAAAEITRAVELRDRQRLVEAVSAGGRLMENESISLVPCLCDECYSWREAVYVGTEVRCLSSNFVWLGRCILSIILTTKPLQKCLIRLSFSGTCLRVGVGLDRCFFLRPRASDLISDAQCVDQVSVIIVTKLSNLNPESCVRLSRRGSSRRLSKKWRHLRGSPDVMRLPNEWP
jgi:ribosomal protein L32E